MSDATDNTIPIEAWDTVLFEKFCRFRYVLTEGVSGRACLWIVVLAIQPSASWDAMPRSWTLANASLCLIETHHSSLIFY